MHLKLISCNVFQREASWCIARSPHLIDPEYTELGEHARSAGLRALIQGKIDAVEASGKTYDAILLLFGLCGNATVGLQARRTRLVMPRAHDCCTILLGSRAKYAEHFSQAPSTPFSSAGYLERGSYFLRTSDDGQTGVQSGDAYRALVAKFGEEDAKFIWAEMNPAHGDNRAVFIDLPQTSHLGYAEQFAAKAQAAGKESIRLEGNIRLIENLLQGDWNEKEYLIVPPASTIEGVYDWDQIVRAKQV
ncbi:MAG: DUF1638 domain-containing protein [bacterium]|nr:DUF1638 domain-containing protein [bacterium]MDI1336903.1 DUF1638 domain-containing protein [Lacunisphaera sp.]